MLCGVSFAASNWFVNTEFKQDFRYRWQEDYQRGVTNNAGDDYVRYRERIRYRFGFETKANDEMFFGARLATGGTTDPLSTNQSMGDGSTAMVKRAITLDQAYLKYTPAWVPAEYGVVMFELGKFDVKDGIYTVTDVMWDSDISLEGKNIAYSYKGIDGLELFANLGSYIMYDASAAPDLSYSAAKLNVQQLGSKWAIDSIYSLEGAVAKYQRDRQGSLDTAAYNIDNNPINQQQVKFNTDAQALGITYFDRVSLFCEQYENNNAAQANVGNAHGFEIGTAKMAKLGDWTFRALRRSLEQNVGWTLGDSDAYGNGVNSAAGLNTRGTEMSFQIGLAENASFTIDQYLMDVYNNDINNDKGYQKMTQFDVNVKF
jgi:hypothetical protein